MGSSVARPVAAFGAMLALWMGIAGPAAADNHPVVVELFTSQGCSSCPPADELLMELAKRPDIIALALHVDYWDYIGWKDRFARPEHTVRQKAYARAAGERMIYTPQMIIGGVDHVIGARAMDVFNALARHEDVPYAVHVHAEREGNTINVQADPPGDALGVMNVQLVRYRPEDTVRILRGENAGRTLSYGNIVTAWDTLETWDGRTPLALRVEISGDQAAVILVQTGEGHGRIVGAAAAQ